MNSEGKVCWLGVAERAAEQLSCTCRTDPPLFDIVFPTTNTTNLSTAAPSTLTDSPSYYTVTPLATANVSFTSHGGGGVVSDPGGGDGDVIAFSTISAATIPDGNTAHKWINEHQSSLKLLIWVFLALVFTVCFLLLLIACYIKRRRKGSPSHRPEAEGCEAEEHPCEVKMTPPTTSTIQNNFPLVNIDQPETLTNQPYLENGHGTPSPSANHNHTAPTGRGYPMMRAVKARIVGSGISPAKTVRPVTRQDSTAPLVAGDYDDGPVYRDRWKNYTPRTSLHPNEDGDENSHIYSEIDPRWRHSNEPETSPLGEAGDRTSTEVPTKVEILPARRYAETSNVGSPSRKFGSPLKRFGSPKRNMPVQRPDSSTPLFDRDSVSSNETEA